MKLFDELILINYCHPDCTPLKNIMRLPEAEAFALAHELVEAHPLSFVIEGSDYLRDWFGNGIETRIPLNEIAPCHISFTIGDSGAEFQKNGCVEILTVNELRGLIDQYGGDFDAFMQVTGKHYIEVQLWSDRYVQS